MGAYYSYYETGYELSFKEEMHDRFFQYDEDFHPDKAATIARVPKRLTATTPLGRKSASGKNRRWNIRQGEE
jgi:hypothetical protein